ncbi:MAG: hypothetical protein AB8G77_00075 [Rhodothermales bacterium]
MLGKIGSMIGNKPVESEVFVDAQHMLSNDGKRTSTIFSIPESKFSTLDHKKKTYYDVTFDEMASMFEGAREGAQQQIDGSEGNPDDVEFSVSVEDMGSSEKIAGYKADRMLVKIDLTFNSETTDDQGNAQQASGKFYAVSEVWVSKDVPGHDVMVEFGQNYADKMGKAFSRNSAGFAAMQQAFMSDGRMQPAMEKMAEEMKKLEGTPLRTVTYLVVGPEDQELDLDAIFGEKKKKKKRGGLGRFAQNALKSQGLNIGGEEESNENSGEITEQTILTETETVYLKVELVDDDAKRYMIPGKYKQIDAPEIFSGDN